MFGGYEAPADRVRVCPRLRRGERAAVRYYEMFKN